MQFKFLNYALTGNLADGEKEISTDRNREIASLQGTRLKFAVKMDVIDQILK